MGNYASSIGSYSSFSNITVTIGEFSNTSTSSSTTYGPSVVYVSDNYSRCAIRSQNSITSSMLGTIGFNRQLYSNYGNKILFCFFPVCFTSNSIRDLANYTTMQLRQIYNYSTISITPQGYYINSPIICDRIFCQNGLYSNKSNCCKDYKSSSVHYVSSTYNVPSFNWQIKTGFTYVANNSTGAIVGTSSTFSHATYIFGKTIQRRPNDKNQASKFPKFKYVRSVGNVAPFGLNKKPNIATTNAAHAYRQYHLAEWHYSHPQTNQVGDGQLINKFPFFFMLKLSKKSNGCAQLRFGTNEIPIIIQMNKNKTTLSVGKQNADIDLTFDQRRVKNVPFFMKTISDATTMIVYPTYMGVSMQAGVQQGGDAVRIKAGDQPLKPNGGYCPFGARMGSGGSKKLARKFPTLQDWILKYKPSTSSNPCNIVAQPWSTKWSQSKGDPLKLIFNDATGSFFYSPLLFLPYAKFRMYFKGIKAGKYDNVTNLPIGNDDFPTNDGTACVSGAVWQYTYRTKAGGSKSAPAQGIKHQYFGSVIFSCEYEIQGKTDKFDKFRNYITCPTTAYRIPPSTSIPNNVIKKQFFNSYSMDSYYFDFNINLSSIAPSPKLARLPIQILGVLIVQKVVAIQSLVDNENGKFSMCSQGGLSSITDNSIIPIYKTTCSNLSNWHKCITNISVTHNQQGSTGTITVDKYALMGQQALPKQFIGGLSIDISGGNSYLINKKSTESNPRSTNRLFTGYVTKMSTNDSANSDTITMTLQGIQKKLTDIKLINPPFWDGDKLKDILNWISFYAGVNINYKDGSINIFDRDKVMDAMSDQQKKWRDSNGVQHTLLKDDVPITPVSSVFSRPAVNYKSGTDCFTVLKDVCFKQCNHRFVLQPNGEAYIFTQSKMAMPLACTKTDLTHFHSAAIDPDLILNCSIQPLLSNLYNFVITASLQGTQQGQKSTGVGDVFTGLKLNKRSQQITYDSTNNWAISIPWSKTIALKHQGYMNQRQLSDQHARNVMLAKNYWLNLKLSIPGNTNIWIYDRLKLFGVDYYVVQVSHNVDFTTKRFVTDVTLCSCVPQVKKNN